MYPEGASSLSRPLQLLPMVYQKLFHHCQTPLQPYKEGHPIHLDGVAETTFQALIRAFTTAPVLALPDHS